MRKHAEASTGEIAEDDIPSSGTVAGNQDNKKLIGLRSESLKLIRDISSASGVPTVCSSSSGSYDCEENSRTISNLKQDLLTTHSPRVIIRGSLNLDRTRSRFGSRNPSYNNLREGTPSKRSPRSALRISADENADETMMRKFSQFSPSNYNGSRSQKDDTGRKERRTPQKTDSVTKRSKHPSLIFSKSSANQASIRPISMSLARRKSIVSKRFDTDTLALLESLNLINTNDTETIISDDEGKHFTTFNGKKICEDDVDDDGDDDTITTPITTDNVSVEGDHEGTFDEFDDVNSGNLHGANMSLSHLGLLPHLGSMDIIYEEKMPYSAENHENSPYYFSTNNSPTHNPRVKLKELKARKQMKKAFNKAPPETNSLFSNEMKNMRGLMAGDGILEFCTVDADLFVFLKDLKSDAKNDSGKDSKKSAYDIDDNDDDAQCKSRDMKKLIASYSSHITPKKTHCLPSMNFSIEHIHDFCFPSGVPVQFMTKQRADQITDSADYDSYHTLQFTDGNNRPTYACCVIINVQYKPKTDLLRRKLSLIKKMNEAADKIISIIRLYISIKKSSHSKQMSRNSKSNYPGSNTKSSQNINNGTYRTYGSNDSNSNWIGGNKNNGTTNGNIQARKRSDSFTTSSSFEKNPVKYLTAKNLKGFASKFLYGRSKSPVDIMSPTGKNNLNTSLHYIDDTYSQSGSQREVLSHSKSFRIKKGPSSNLRESRANGSNSIIVKKCISEREGEKEINNAYTATTISIFETPAQVIKRINIENNGVDISDMNHDKKNKSSPIISLKDQGRLHSFDSYKRFLTTTEASEMTSNNDASNSKSFFSVHLNKQKINGELKEKQKKDHQVMKRKRKEDALRLVEDSYVLLTQKAYCLISSEEKQSTLFQVLKMMVNSERNKHDSIDIHNFEEQEEIASKMDKISAITTSPIDENSENLHGTKFDENFLIIEKFFPSREGTPQRSKDKKKFGTELGFSIEEGVEINFHEVFKGSAGLNKRDINHFDKLSPKSDDLFESNNTGGVAQLEIEREFKRIAREKLYSKRNNFLLAIEKHLRKSKTLKHETQTVTRTIVNEKTDYITKVKVITTTTQKIFTEKVPFPSYITVPDYIDKSFVDFSSFPSTKDWTSAILFATLSSEMFFKVMHLVLTEKSLVIYGTDKGYITAICLAIKEIIQPLHWEGIFVPLISNSARELFEAPVPYILGTTFMPNLDFISPTAAVIHILHPEHDAQQIREKEIRDKEIHGKEMSEKEIRGKNIRKSSIVTNDGFTWKDRASNAKGHTPFFEDKKFEKPSNCDSFESIQRNYEKGPRASFIRLPDVHEKIPSAPYLADWIDRTRRLLSHSIMQYEGKEREKRVERRLVEEKEKEESREKENSDISMKKASFDGSNRKSDAQNGLNCTENKCRRDSGANEVEIAVEGRPRNFSIGAESDTTPPNVPKLSLNSADNDYFVETMDNSPVRNDPESPKGDISSELMLKLERARILGAQLARLNDTQHRISEISIDDGEKEKENGGNMRNSGEREKESEMQFDAYIEKKKSREEQNKSFSECDFEKVRNDNEKRWSKGDRPLSFKKRTVSFSLDSYSSDTTERENDIHTVHTSHVINSSGQIGSLPSSTASSPLYSSLLSKNTPFEDPSPSRDDSQTPSFFFTSTSTYSSASSTPALSLSTSTLPLSTTVQSVSLQDYFNTYPANRSSTSTSPNFRQMISPILPKIKVTKEDILNSLDMDSSKNSEVGEQITDKNMKSPRRSDDEKDDEICRKKSLVRSSSASDILISASNYSPYRKQGNGKTWLEQIIQATEKPHRQQGNTRLIRGNRRGINGVSEKDQEPARNLGPGSSTLLTRSLSSSMIETFPELKPDSHMHIETPTTDLMKNTSSLRLSSPHSHPPTPPLLPFINGMTKMELQTTQKLLLEIRKYTCTFLGRLYEPNAWKEFVKYNRATNDDEFYPDMFLQPLRSNLEFQESLVKTQLFVAYMDRLRSEYNEKESTRTFISDWLRFRIYYRNKVRNSL